MWPKSWRRRSASCQSTLMFWAPRLTMSWTRFCSRAAAPRRSRASSSSSREPLAIVQPPLLGPHDDAPVGAGVGVLHPADRQSLVEQPYVVAGGHHEDVRDVDRVRGRRLAPRQLDGVGLEYDLALGRRAVPLRGGVGRLDPTRALVDD